MISKFIAFGCSHIPLQDEESLSIILDEIARTQPDYVIGMGDWHEAAAVSKFQDDYSWGLREEMDQVGYLMTEINTAAPKATKVFIEGNHDKNIRDWKRTSQKLVDLIDYRNHPMISEYLSSEDWVWVPYEFSKRGCYWLNQICFTHGYKYGQGSDRAQALNKCFRIPYGLFASVHTHRPVDITWSNLNTANIKLDQAYCNVGCTRDLEPDYMADRDKTAWGNAYLIGECSDWRYKDSFIPNKPLWDAELRVIKMWGEE
jgi:predicted phosphodiesterase